MPPRKGKKPVKTPAVVYDWMGDPGLAQLSESQLNFLYENGDTAPLIICDLRKHGTITIPNPSEAGLSSFQGSSTPAPTAHDNDNSDWDAAASQIEASILGKWSFFFFFKKKSSGIYFNMDLWGDLHCSPTFTYTWPISRTLKY
jgi:hypothetical protein